LLRILKEIKISTSRRKAAELRENKAPKFGTKLESFSATSIKFKGSFYLINWLMRIITISRHLK
jgi:hypothetical protein